MGSSWKKEEGEKGRKAENGEGKGESKKEGRGNRREGLVDKGKMRKKRTQDGRKMK